MIFEKSMEMQEVGFHALFHFHLFVISDISKIVDRDVFIELNIPTTPLAAVTNATILFPLY